MIPKRQIITMITHELYDQFAKQAATDDISVAALLRRVITDFVGPIPKPRTPRKPKVT